MTSSGKDKPHRGHPLSQTDLMDEISRAKLKRRVELANLPFPEKVRIVVELQKIDNSLAKAAGRKPKKVWKL
jgi:hypothetical protein